MKVEVDQSNRLENAGPTFLAFANRISYVIKIPTKVKQIGVSLLEAEETPQKQIKPLLWAACVFLLLKNHLGQLVKEAGKIIIDNELDGHQALIKSALLRHIRHYYDKFPTHKVEINSITKKSSAHAKAWEAHKGKRPVDKVITEEELMKILA